MVEQSPEPPEIVSTPEPDLVGDAVTFLNATTATAIIGDYLNGNADAKEASAALIIVQEYIDSHSESSSRDRVQAFLDYLDSVEAVETLQAYVSGKGTAEKAAEAHGVINDFILKTYRAS